MWGNHPEWKQPLVDMIAIFEKANPGVKIELDTKTSGEYPQALSTSMAGGVGPDLIGWGPGGFVFDAFKAGQILDLTGKVPVDNLVPSAAAQVTSKEGKVLGVPLSVAIVLPIFSKKAFQQANVQPPNTWEEWVEAAQKLQGAGLIPFVMGAKEGAQPFFMYTLAVSSILGEDGFNDLLAGKIKLTDPKLLPAARLLKTFQPFFPEGFEAVPSVESRIEFVRGKGAVVFTGTSDLATYRLQDPNFEVDVFGFPPPAGSNGKPTTQYGYELTYTVNSQTKFPEEATAFVAWLASKEAQQYVADLLGEPIATGVFPSDAVKKKMLEAGQTSVPVWRDTPPFRDSVGAMVKDGMGIFSNRLTPEQFAEAMQASMRTTFNT